MVRDLATPPRVPRWSSPTPSWWPRPRGHARARRLPQRPVRADPSTRRRPTTVREVPLLIVPPTINKFYIADLAPGRSLVEHLVGGRPAGLPDLLAQPGRAARDWGAGRLRRRPCWPRWTRSRRSPGSPHRGRSGLCSGGMHHHDAAGPPRRHRRVRSGSRRCRFAGHRARPDPGRDRWARSPTSAPPPRPTTRSTRRVTWTAQRWPRCSPGCGPTTWCGTTGSTTTCWASPRRRSTSCPGTPTRPG